MAQASGLSPELARGVLLLAQALLTASRNWTLYPSQHPAVGAAIDRLAQAIRHASPAAIMTIGVTPDTLLVEGAPADSSHPAIAEAAAFLHDRDILQLTFVGDAPPEALRTLVSILGLEPAVRRDRGGPAAIWAVQGHSCLAIDQIDYQQVLARERTADTPEPARRDDLWRGIVQSIASEQKAVFDERAQERLLAIAGSAVDIGDLATAVMAPRCTLDGSPLITSQAAAVIAAYRHLMSIVSVMAPERLPEVMGNLAAASATLDPNVLIQVLRTDDDPGERLPVVAGMTAAFDDTKVAQLLATSLALDGQASDRLATIFNTIAPDPERKQRVMALTRNLLAETDFGQSNHFQTLWTSMEELLISYNDRPFVSETYRTALDHVGTRAEQMAARDLPPELPEWMETLGQDNVRSLSVTLLIDLLNLEGDEARAFDLARDMGALAEDLLLAGAYADTRAVVSSLSARARQQQSIGRDGCRQALDRLGDSLGLRETAALLGDLDEAAWAEVRGIIEMVGPSGVEALKPSLTSEDDSPASLRAADLVVGFHAAAVSRLGPLLADSRWFVQRNGARLLGRIAVPDAVSHLQPLLRRSDPRVAREAVAALAGIDDPSAARAIHNVLRSATGEMRRAVVEALVADRDPRVVPILTRIVDESQALGKDHQVVLDTLQALGVVGTDQAVPTLNGVIRTRAFFRRRKLRAIKEQGVAALATIGTVRAADAIDEAARTGDRLLKKVIARRRA